MRLSDFDYNLPKELIAQEPATPRDHSRLLVLDKVTGAIAHRHFYDIIDYLNPGDVLVMNNSKVFPARLIGRRKDTGGKIEIFLVREMKDADLSAVKFGYIDRGIRNLELGIGNCEWLCLVGGKVQHDGMEVEFDEGLSARILKNNGDGIWIVRFDTGGQDFMDAVYRIGRVPLPPYIKRDAARTGGRGHDEVSGNDKKNYQTVYAAPDKIGSVAAPTAGLHFTDELLEKLKNKGVQFEYVTLHVGLGTFAPVKTENIEEHKMHAEYVEVDAGTIERVVKAKQEGRRVIAVGTTSVRTLEAVIGEYVIGNLPNYQLPITNFNSFVNIFIYPGYEFIVIDAMITNFHLPKSTLLMLVSALAGKANIDRAYVEAVEKKYRFFSYGDAMLIE